MVYFGICIEMSLYYPLLTNTCNIYRFQGLSYKSSIEIYVLND